MPVIAHFFQRAFAIDLFLQSPQSLVYGFTFFQPDFGQFYFTSSLRLPQGRETPLSPFYSSQGD